MTHDRDTPTSNNPKTSEKGLRIDIDQKTGVHIIDRAEWARDSWGCLILSVRNNRDLPVYATLSLRQPYCDRGHIQLLISGITDLDYADSFPRFFFSFGEADHHTRTFLKWRLFAYRVYPHALELPTPHELTDEEKSDQYWRSNT